MNKLPALVLVLATVVFTGIPQPADANSSDINGGMAIGTGYAGVDAAPTNGLIVQGNVGIGTSSPGAPLDVGSAGSTTGTVQLEGGTSGYVQIQPAGAAGSWTLTLPANAGTNGYLLQTDGSGITSWVANSAGSASPLAPSRRLSLSSTSPVLTADVTAATTIYFLPWQGELVPIYNGSTWQAYDFGSSLSLSLNPTEEVAGDVFDVYVLNSSGSPVLCAMNWGGTASRCTTAGGTSGSANASVTQLKGLWVNNAAIAASNCYNGTTSYAISQNQGTLLGSFYTPTATSTTLSSNINSSTTSVPVAAAISGAGLIGVNYYEAIDTGGNREYVLVTGGWNGTTQTVTRGQLGTTAIAHSSGVAVAVAGGQTAVQFNPAIQSGGAGNLVGLANVYNVISQGSANIDTLSQTTYAAAVERIINNSAANKTYFVQPLPLRPFSAMANMVFSETSATNVCQALLAQVNSTTTLVAQAVMTGTNATPLTIQASYYPVMGLNYLAPLQYVSSGTCTLGPGGGIYEFFTVSGQF